MLRAAREAVEASGAEIERLTSDLDDSRARIAELEEQLAAAKQAPPAETPPVKPATKHK